MTTIRLQHVPPSTNGLYFNRPGKGRVKTDRYRTWLQAAGWDLKRYHNIRFSQPVHLDIKIGKLRANADISNRIKALEDLLVTHKVIPGDSIQWVKGVNIHLSPEPFEGVEIEITPAEPERKAA